MVRPLLSTRNRHEKVTALFTCKREVTKLYIRYNQISPKLSKSVLRSVCSAKAYLQQMLRAYVYYSRIALSLCKC